MGKLRSKRLPIDEYSEYYDESGPGQGRQPGPGKERPAETRTAPPSSLIHLTVLAAIGLMLLGLVWMVAGWPMLKITLKELLAPVGLVWMGLFLALYFCLLNRRGFASILVLTVWLILTVSGNSMFNSWLAHSLQKEYTDFDFDRLQKLDIVLVLGGGLSTTPGGQAQLSGAGDRGMMAARLLLNDKTRRVLCSGTSPLPLPKSEMTQANALESLLLSLGIPQDRLLKIGGRSTLQEMQMFDQWITTNGGSDLKKGIVTSAWHLRRAMRLAHAVGIQAEPIPADFINTRIRQSPNLLIPGAGYLVSTTSLLKEHLAGLVGR